MVGAGGEGEEDEAEAGGLEVGTGGVGGEAEDDLLVLVLFDAARGGVVLLVVVDAGAVEVAGLVLFTAGADVALAARFMSSSSDKLEAPPLPVPAVEAAEPEAEEPPLGFGFGRASGAGFLTSSVRRDAVGSGFEGLADGTALDGPEDGLISTRQYTPTINKRSSTNAATGRPRIRAEPARNAYIG